MTNTLFDALDLAFLPRTIGTVEKKRLELRQIFLERKKAHEEQEIYALVDEINKLAVEHQRLFSTPGEASEKFEEHNRLMNEIIKRFLLAYNKKFINDNHLDSILFALFQQKKELLFTRFLFYFVSTPEQLLSLENNFFQQEINDFINLVKPADFLLEDEFNRSRHKLIYFFMEMRALIDYTSQYLCSAELKNQIEELDTAVFLALTDKLHPYGEESLDFMTKLAVLYVRYTDRTLNQNHLGYHKLYNHIHMLKFFPQIIDEEVLINMTFNPKLDTFIDLISVFMLNSYLKFLYASISDKSTRKDLDSLFTLCDPAVFPFCFMPDFFLYLKREAKSVVNRSNDAETKEYYNGFMRTCDEKLARIKTAEELVTRPEEEQVLLMRKAENRLAECVLKVNKKKKLFEAELYWFRVFYVDLQKQFTEEAYVPVRTEKRNGPREDLSVYFSGDDDWDGSTQPITPFSGCSYDRTVADLRGKCKTFFSSCSKNAQWGEEDFSSLVEDVKQVFSPEETEAFYKKAVNNCLLIVKKHQYCYWMLRFVNGDQKSGWDWGHCRNGDSGREYVNIAKAHFAKGLEHIIKTVELLEEAETKIVDQSFLVKRKYDVQVELDLINQGLTDFCNDSQVKAKFFRDRAQAKREREAQRAKESGESLVQEETAAPPMPETTLHKSGYSFFGDTMKEILRLKGVTARL